MNTLSWTKSNWQWARFKDWRDINKGISQSTTWVRNIALWEPNITGIVTIRVLVKVGPSPNLKLHLDCSVCTARCSRFDKVSIYVVSQVFPHTVCVHPLSIITYPMVWSIKSCLSIKGHFIQGTLALEDDDAEYKYWTWRHKLNQMIQAGNTNQRLWGFLNSKQRVRVGHKNHGIRWRWTLFVHCTVKGDGPGGRLNKKDGLTRYGDSHVKDKTF